MGSSRSLPDDFDFANQRGSRDRTIVQGNVEASQAVEVVPLLGLRRLPQAPPGVAGVLNYRGRPVPAIDLCALTMGRPSRELLSTRIIVLQHQEAPAGRKLGKDLVVIGNVGRPDRAFPE